MLHNIFSNKKTKNKNNKILKIIVDIHEKNSLVLSNLHILGIESELQSLEIGDYLIKDVIIERKTFSDFISSIIDKRLMMQLENMQAYEKKLLLLEGKEFDNIEFSNLNPNAIRGMILSISLNYKIPIIFTKNEKESATYIYLLARQQEKNQIETSLHSKKGKTKKEKMEYILESFSNIGPKNAKKLLEKFKTIKNIVQSSSTELEKEIGKKAEEFKIVDEEY
jgi:Fanconi anemia group M protein